ncbi:MULTISPECIES: hypothetical protein [Asanoa]|uniref:Mce-associated membrane protein n=2 Tax=Asanoa TaxID=195964 RepID=A0A239PF41_9ACTN|nr:MULTISPECIES: hypothetical protein [Asanoa]GIF74201.1 hypothetical protein Asi02nite_37190 [Asanoa siamensis]SNT65716.1 hypothetical protein SAMN05421812_12559 [Asanoa hainanensis]
MRRRTDRARLLLVASACGVLITGAACSDEAATPGLAGSPTVVAPSATEDPAQAQARTDVMAVYSFYRTAYQAAASKADFKSKELPKYAAEPLLGQLVNSFAQMREAGVVSRGESIWDPTVVDVDLDASPAIVTIEDCRDTTAVVTVSAKTGKPMPAPSNQAKKYVVVSKAKSVNNRWYIFESTGDRSRPC